MPIRCNSESNLLEAVAEQRAINKMTHRSQDDTQVSGDPVYCVGWVAPPLLPSCYTQPEFVFAGTKTWLRVEARANVVRGGPPQSCRGQHWSSTN